MIVVSTYGIFPYRPGHTKFFATFRAIKFITFYGMFCFGSHSTIFIYYIRTYDIISPILNNFSTAMRTGNCMCKQSYQLLFIFIGIGNKIDNAVKSLSGGERQRLFIVLALIPNPELVFLDELTTGLDAKARRDVWKILSELKSKGLTIFLTSHFMDEVEALCDEICILKKGKAVFYGTTEQAKEASGCEKFEDAYLALSGEEVTKE